MNEKKAQISILILLLIFIIISSVTILLNGKTYTVKYDIEMPNATLDDVTLELDSKDIVEIVDKKIEKNTLKIKLSSISKGHTFLSIKEKNKTFSKNTVIYVHDSGVITIDDYFGDSTMGIISPICTLVLIIYILAIRIFFYRKNIKENIYQYKNISYLGTIIFLTFTLINQILSLFQYKGLISLVTNIIRISNLFSSFFFPLAFITSIFVMISNVILIKREGLSIKNLLATILGITFCLATIMPPIISEFVYQSETFGSIHNLNAPTYYIFEFIESVVYVVVAYLECILIGTIVVAVKSAKRIPSFDKDYIIILGCQVKKDGKPTNLLKSRIDRAIEFYKMQKEKTGKELVFVPSGGQGSDEAVSEALSMNNYLLEQDFSKDKILLEDKSTNTYENIKYSMDKISNKDAKVAFSTTNYHVFRAGVIATNQGYHVEGIGAKTKSYFWINAFVREFIATIVQEKKRHIFMIIILMLAMFSMVFVIYLSNNM